MNEFVEGLTKVGVYLFDIYLSRLPALQAFSLVITGVLLFFVVRMMVRANIISGKRDKFIDKWNLADMPKRKVVKAWKDIAQDVGSGGSAKMKKAINDADKIVDEALKNVGIVGKDMDERLAKTDEMRVVNIREVCEAHRLVARMQKEPALSLTAKEGWNIIAIYEKALKELGMLK